MGRSIRLGPTSILLSSWEHNNYSTCTYIPASSSNPELISSLEGGGAALEKNPRIFLLAIAIFYPYDQEYYDDAAQYTRGNDWNKVYVNTHVHKCA